MKKNFLSIILLIIIFFVLIFLVVIIRKMMIISNIEKNVSKYLNSDNFHEKIITDEGDSSIVTNYYSKENNAVLVLISTIKTSGETKKIINYYEENKINTYIEISDQKIAILNSNSLPSKTEIINTFNYDGNILELFRLAIVTSISNVELKGKDCYLVRNSQNEETYIEKETGLVIKSKNGTINNENGIKSDIINEYYYEFKNVTDNDVKEPNISEYTIQ